MADTPELHITVQILERLLAEKIMAYEAWGVAMREARSLSSTDNLEFRVAADVRETEVRIMRDAAEARYNQSIERYCKDQVLQKETP